MTDVVLAFPPLTEAVQFPYLALPQLTAAWRGQGITVRQRNDMHVRRQPNRRPAP